MKTLLLVSQAILLLGAVVNRPLPGITVSSNSATIDFPGSIEFKISASSEQSIESVVLEYGTDEKVCGQGVGKAIPQDFTSGLSIDVTWTWNMRRTGELPPGTIVWWRWVLHDAAGEEFTTPEKRLRFIDDGAFDWHSLETIDLTLYWHEGTEPFAQQLIDHAQAAVDRLKGEFGVELDGRIEVYIYANSNEMRQATLFPPSWSGGFAFPSHRKVILGVSTADLIWGKRAMAHEMTHVVVGSFTFSCLDSTPQWLSEGLAMALEGEPEEYQLSLLSKAIEQDQLLSVRELGNMFSEDPELARLAYIQSRSLVEFIRESFGSQALHALLEEFRSGTSEDRALGEVLSLDRDSLEAAWRDWVGARPMGTAPLLEPTPTRTLYPTLQPILTQARQSTATLTPTAHSEHTSTPTPIVLEAVPESTSAIEILPLALVVGFGVCLLIVGWWIAVRKKRALEEHDE